MKNSRNFISANLTEDMLRVVTDGRCLIAPSKVSVEDLTKLKNLYSSIKNKALVGTLKNLGVNLDNFLNKFQVASGDTLYVVNAVGIQLRQYKEEDKLPDSTTLEVTKYLISEKGDN